MADMPLMGIKSEDMYMSSDHIQYHLMFGSKTDRPKHLSAAVYIFKQLTWKTACLVSFATSKYMADTVLSEIS